MTDVPALTCRDCGCSGLDACVVTNAPPRAWNQPGQPCWWVAPDLCSACADRIDPRLTWCHGGQNTGQHPAGLSLKEKAAFSWVAFTMLVGIADLLGLL